MHSYLLTVRNAIVISPIESPIPIVARRAFLPTPIRVATLLI